jgi:L,D-peptidoglycan transpeptidase YkuD (ErfK/YbiS/YcfS/YnhG family)
MAEARTPAFEASSSGLLRWGGREVRCALGRSGVLSPDLKREGDGATPLGTWPMRQVFWRPDRLALPETALPSIPIDRNLGWCDDPREALYNRLVILPFPARHERLWREDELYDLIVVLGFNDDPPIPDRGSAIFLHVAQADYSPTEGCIACARDDLLALLAEAKRGDVLRIAE